jgi:2-polyprenyl-3-methyl-5-hydroxy-6-metoxy-1,4-benzoquinol methylase
LSTSTAKALEATCPLCGHPGRALRAPFGSRWDGRQFDFVKCQGCGSQFRVPLPSADDLRRMYTQDVYHDEHYAELLDVPKASLAALRPFVPVGARLLDFGCGNGRFLSAAKAAGYHATGVELDQHTREHAAANSGCDVLSLEEIVAQKLRFDVIHLGDVLEHLPDPVEVMNELVGALAPGGVFLLEGPLEDNRSLVSWSARAVRRIKTMLGRSNYALRAPTHLTRTTAASQRAFFTSALGHEVVHFEVSEDGWPYIPLGGVGARGVRRIIGRASIGVARVANQVGLDFGDRFVAVTRPK